MGNLIAAIGVGVSALVAATGYVIAQRQIRRERLAKVFADALSAVSEFQNYPFLVARRPDGESIQWLVKMSAEVHASLDYHARPIRLETPAVTSEFEAVVAAARVEIGDYGKQAWRMPPVATGEDMNRDLGDKFPATRTKAAIELCLTAMAVHLGGRGGSRRARR